MPYLKNIQPVETAQPNNCITLNELNQLIEKEKQKVKVIDVRSSAEFDELHIPGAINIALANIELVNKLFGKEDFIVTVCGKGGGRSATAAGKLLETGFRNCSWLYGGTFGWF